MTLSKVLTFSAVCGLLLFPSCSKEVINELDSNGQPTCKLNIITRNGTNGDEEGNSSPTISEGRIYIFNGTNCVSMLSFDESTSSITSEKLPAGSYTVYAIGGEISNFVFPEQNAAKPNSEITLGSGKTLDDILMASATASSLTDGETRTLNMTLERKVLRIEQVTIKKVPTDVTGVEVVLEPFYKKICINGNYSEDTEATTISLTKSSDQTTWQATPKSYLYPSSGKPTITIRFIRGTDIKSYSYTAAEAWPANHKTSIEGTYTAAQGVTLTGVLTGSDWEDPKNIIFEFDEDNANNSNNNNNNNDPSDAPVAGQFYKGCYVVSVNGNQATLVSNTQKTYSELNQEGETYIDGINAALESWPSETGISGTWRVPTETEARIFLVDQNCTTISAMTPYFCLNNQTLKTIWVMPDDGSNTIDNTSTTLGINRILRPVIDITF